MEQKQHQLKDVYEPSTGIAAAPSVVLELRHAAQVSQLTGPTPPASVLLHLDSSLNVVTEDGSGLASLPEAIERLCVRVIPAFVVHDEATATALGSWLQQQELIDLFVVSTQPGLVSQLKKAHALIRGVLDCRAWPERQLLELRREANRHHARVVLVSQEQASRAAVGRLQRLLMTVWVAESPNATHPRANQFNLVATGANAIVTRDSDSLIDVLQSEFPADRPTLVRKPLVIGHRGIPFLAPENTLAGALLAYEHGAAMIESDIHLSKDGEVIIHHDDSLERTTTGSGALRELSASELATLKANRQFPTEFPEAGIPTLREYLAAFRDLDVVHVIEIKADDPELPAKAAALVQEFDAADQVVFISFHAEQLKRLREALPGMSTGFLTLGLTSESEPLASLHRVLETIEPLDSTYNPFVLGLGPAFVKAARHRGITIWPWTFKDQESFVNMLLAGTGGLTTDATHLSGSWAVGINSPGPLSLCVGESLRLNATIERQDRSASAIDPEVSVLEGKQLLRADGSVLTGLAPGEAWVTLRYWQDVTGDKGYYVYSPAVRVDIRDCPGGSEPSAV